MIDSREAWVAGAIRSLNMAGSWTGRLHIHKLLVVTKLLELEQIPFRFRLYHYGPYSSGVDDTLGAMVCFGCVTETYPSPDYGPKHALTPSGERIAESLPEQARRLLDRVAKEFGQAKSQELELQATALWAKFVEECTDMDSIASRVRELKPRYTPDQVRQQVEAAERLESALRRIRSVPAQ